MRHDSVDGSDSLDEKSPKTPTTSSLLSDNGEVNNLSGGSDIIPVTIDAYNVSLESSSTLCQSDKLDSYNDQQQSQQHQQQQQSDNHIDLKCTENVSDIENNDKHQQGFDDNMMNNDKDQQDGKFDGGSGKNNMEKDITLKPKPIKFPHEPSLFQQIPLFSYSSPKNPIGVTPFQPTGEIGYFIFRALPSFIKSLIRKMLLFYIIIKQKIFLLGGAFKTMPISPKSTVPKPNESPISSVVIKQEQTSPFSAKATQVFTFPNLTPGSHSKEIYPQLSTSSMDITPNSATTYKLPIGHRITVNGKI